MGSCIMSRLGLAGEGQGAVDRRVRPSGFSMLELVVTLAIVLIASAMAIPVVKGVIGQYQVNAFQRFDELDAKPVALLKGGPDALNGDGWSGAIAGGHFTASKGGGKFSIAPCRFSSCAAVTGPMPAMPG